MIAVPVSLLLIFILLFTFNSVKQGLLIYSAIPFRQLEEFSFSTKRMPLASAQALDCALVLQ
jgi:cobalt-zinc-cadmium resistance protein CzcA